MECPDPLFVDDKHRRKRGVFIPDVQSNGFAMISLKIGDMEWFMKMNLRTCFFLNTSPKEKNKTHIREKPDKK